MLQSETHWTRKYCHKELLVYGGRLRLYGVRAVWRRAQITPSVRTGDADRCLVLQTRRSGDDVWLNMKTLDENNILRTCDVR